MTVSEMTALGRRELVLLLGAIVVSSGVASALTLYVAVGVMNQNTASEIEGLKAKVASLEKSIKGDNFQDIVDAQGWVNVTGIRVRNSSGVPMIVLSAAKDKAEIYLRDTKGDSHLTLSADSGIARLDLGGADKRGCSLGTGNMFLQSFLRLTDGNGKVRLAASLDNRGLPKLALNDDTGNHAALLFSNLSEDQSGASVEQGELRMFDKPRQKSLFLAPQN